MTLSKLITELQYDNTDTTAENLMLLMNRLRFGKTLELRFLEDKSYRQIAADLEISHTAAKDQVTLMLELLKLKSIKDFVEGKSKSTLDTLLTYQVPIRIATKLEELGMTDVEDVKLNLKNHKKDLTRYQISLLKELCGMQNDEAAFRSIDLYQTVILSSHRLIDLPSLVCIACHSVFDNQYRHSILQVHVSICSILDHLRFVHSL